VRWSISGMGFSGVREAAVPCRRHERVELLARKVHEAFMIASFKPDLRRPVEPIIDDRFDTIGLAEGRNGATGAVAEQPVGVVLAGQLDRPVQESPELSLMELAGRRQHSDDVTLPITHKDCLSKMIRRNFVDSGSLPRGHGPLMNENVIADIMPFEIPLHSERDRHGCLLYLGARW
jgi:hypothetical protein